MDCVQMESKVNPNTLATKSKQVFEAIDSDNNLSLNKYVLFENKIHKTKTKLLNTSTRSRHGLMKKL